MKVDTPLNKETRPKSIFVLSSILSRFRLGKPTANFKSRLLR